MDEKNGVADDILSPFEPEAIPEVCATAKRRA